MIQGNFWVLMRCSDRVFTWSNGAGVWTSLRHVGRIKASRFESDHATLPWLLIKDRDTEPASQPDGRTDTERESETRQRDRWTPQSWGLHTVKLSEGKRHCKKGTVKTVFFFLSFLFLSGIHILNRTGCEWESSIRWQIYQKSLALIAKLGQRHLSLSKKILIAVLI